MKVFKNKTIVYSLLIPTLHYLEVIGILLIHGRNESLLIETFALSPIK